jgi:hypothetical protein
VASEAQARRFWAIAYESARLLGLSSRDARDRAMAVLGVYGVTEPEDLEREEYDDACQELEDWGAGE